MLFEWLDFRCFVCKIIPMWIRDVVTIITFLKFNILDLPRHYARSGDIESAIRAYSEIYRTANDSVIKYQALYEQAELYLKRGDTISALVNLYKLKLKYLPDSLARKVFNRLFYIDKMRLGKNATRFALLYPYVRNRRAILEKLLLRIDSMQDTIHYISVLRVLASDYGGKYKKMLSEYVYKNNLERRIFDRLFKETPTAPFFYYLHKNDTFSAFYSLFGRKDPESRKLRLDILYSMGAYDACYRLISDYETNETLLKIKLLSAIKLRIRADSITLILKKNKRNKRLYRELLHFLDTIPEYGLLRAYLQGNIKGIIYHGMRTQSGLKDTIFLKTSIDLAKKGEYGLAKVLIKSVGRYYPHDTLSFWKYYILSKKEKPQDILLSNKSIMEKIKALYKNGYYAELVQYAKGKELPRQAGTYIVESLYMLWKLYKRRSYLKNAFTLMEKYRIDIPRNLYFKVVLDYDPLQFNIERYSYENLSREELYALYLLLKKQNKTALLKGMGKDIYYKYLYGLSTGNVDSVLKYLPRDEKFIALVFTEISVSDREDSLKILKRLLKLKIDYFKSPSKEILKGIIRYAFYLDDVFGADTLLEKYKKYYGLDRFYALLRSKWYFNMREYKKSLLYSLFYNDNEFQSLQAANLLKLGRIDAVDGLVLDAYDKNLLYLKTGMLKKVKLSLLDREDALYYLKELIKGNYDKEFVFERLSEMLGYGVIDSMTFTSYGIFIGYIKEDTAYLNSYGRSLVRYLKVKALIREHKLDSALSLIKNPENAVDTIKYYLYFKKGTILYLKKRYKEAMNNYIKASGLESLKDAAIFNAYLSAKRANLKTETISLLEKYISDCIVCEKLPDAYISLGFNYIEMGKPDSAIVQLKKIEGYLDLSQEAELKYWLGTAYMQDSLFDIAGGYFLRVYKFHRKDGQWGDTGGLNAARLLYTLGLKNKAVSIYKSIIKRRKNDALAQEARKELGLIK